MKCSNCGKEFGEGINCQYCGIDRVTGLGNYSGYENPNWNNDFDSSDYIKTDSTKTTVCYACKEIIPADSLFCPYCRKKLWVKCPNCGHEYSSQYPNCNQCGTNLNQYLKEEEEKERIKKEKEAEEKRIEQEKKEEEKNKLEAYKLRNNLYSSSAYVGFSMILAIILFSLFIYLTYIYTDYVVLWVIICVLPCFVIPILAIQISESRDKSIIEKWKKEHPNDPRSKYL